MTKTEILDDIDYVKTLAKEGRHAPYTGGRIGLMWGVLLSITLLIHWAVISDRIDLPVSSLAFLWIGYGIFGFVACSLLARHSLPVAGQSSVNNQIAQALWIANAIFLSTYAISAGLSAGYRGNNFIIMDTILPVAFGLYGLIHFVLARLSHEKWQYIPAIVSLAFVPIFLFLQGQASLYLAAAFGALATIIIPSLVYINREPKAVV